MMISDSIDASQSLCAYLQIEVVDVYRVYKIAYNISVILKTVKIHSRLKPLKFKAFTLAFTSFLQRCQMSFHFDENFI